jgi:hypothetical protein
MLVKIALFSLHEAGTVDLRPFDEKRFRFLPWSGVRVRLVDASAEVSSIEGDLLSEVASDKRGRERRTDISLLVNLLYRDRKPPESLVLNAAIDNAVKLGYAHRVPTDIGAVNHHFTGKPRTRLEADQDRIETLAGEADVLVKSWNEFQNAESNVGRRLSTAVDEAFSLLRRSSRSDD